jgi:Transposase DDE domain
VSAACLGGRSFDPPRLATMRAVQPWDSGDCPSNARHFSDTNTKTILCTPQGPLAKTEAFERSRHDRKRVEMLFANLKRILRLGRLRLRGPCGAQFEFTLAAIAQNLRRLANRRTAASPTRPLCG